MRTRTIAVLSGGLSVPSSTRLLADRLAATAKRSLADHGDDAVLEVVELRPLAHEVTNAVLTGFPAGALRDAVAAVTGADALIAVTPVYNASYAGLFKSFFDVLDEGALDGVPTVLGATGGTARHSLVLDHALRPLFAYLRASVVATGVFAAAEDWASSAGHRLDARVNRAGEELAAMVAARSRPTWDRQHTDLIPFERLLGEQ